MKRGELVSSEIVVKLLLKAFKSAKSHTYLIDGFPRNQENVDVWNRLCGHVEIAGVINLECPDEVLLERALGRGTGRQDDKEEVIRQRI
jgi:UMP-CMP kinase